MSTIGVQRQYNYALQPMSRDEFIRLVTAEQPDAPAYFTYDAVLNTKERPTLDVALRRGLTPLALGQVLDRRRAGAQLLDVREAAEYCGGHLRGSLNIGLSGQFATWAGTLLDRQRPIVLVASPGREEEAAIRLGRIGFDHVAGYLEGGMQAAEGEPGEIARVDRLSATTVAEALAASDPPALLDVRTLSERRQSAIEGSQHIPLDRLPSRTGELPPHRRVVVYCASGYRSSIAVSLLRAAGVAEVFDLLGGIGAWEKSGLPVAGGPSRTAATPSDYAERVEDVQGSAVRFTSYALSGRHYCKAESADTGLCLARAEGASNAEAEAAVRAEAARYLVAVRRVAG